MIECLARLWDAAYQRSAGDLDIAHFRLAVTHAVNGALRVVNLVFHAVGINAIYTANPYPPAQGRSCSDHAGVNEHCAARRDYNAAIVETTF